MATTIKKLPNRREGYNQKVKIHAGDGIKTLYIRTEEFPRGVLKGIRVDIDKEGTLINGLVDCFCIMVNIALQNGIPLSTIAEEFIFTNFYPQGVVTLHPYIKRCTSILDLVFRDLLITYDKRDDLKHVEV